MFRSGCPKTGSDRLKQGAGISQLRSLHHLSAGIVGHVNAFQEEVTAETVHLNVQFLIR